MTTMSMNASEECLERYYKECGSSKAQIKEDAQLVKKWLQQQPHLPNVEDDALLENMLIRCKCSVERAKQMWDYHFTIKGALPEIFGNRDPLNPKYQKVNQILLQGPLPKLTSDGYQINFIKILDKEGSDVPPDTYLEYCYMQADVELMTHKNTGFIFIGDCRHVTLDFIARCTLSVLKKTTAIVKAYKPRSISMHYINVPPGAEMLMAMVKQVFKSDAMARLHIHPDLESLHKYIDKDLLPKEYGGLEKSMEEISNDRQKKLESYREWFLKQNVIGRTDESKRPGKSIDTEELFGFEGTFRKLTVD